MSPNNGLHDDNQSSMFNRSLTKQYPYAVAAEGIYVILKDGQKIIDGCCGAAVSCLGYQHPKELKLSRRELKLSWKTWRPIRCENTRIGKQLDASMWGKISLKPVRALDCSDVANV